MAVHNELVFRGIAQWARWTSVGTALSMFRVGGPGFGVALKCAAAISLLTGLFFLLAHRPPRPLRTAGQFQVLLECLSAGAVLAALWPGVPAVPLALPAVLATLGSGLLWIRCAAAVRPVLPEAALSLQRTGNAWLLIHGLGSVVVVAIVYARGQGNLQVDTPLAPCLVWAVFAVPVIMGLAGAAKLHAALQRPADTCGNCRFSLVGLRDPICPECGAPVRGPLPGPGESAVEPDAVGLRVATAAILITGAGAAAYFQLPGNGLAKHKPFWLLRRDSLTTSGSPAPWHNFMGREKPKQRYPTPGATEAIKELADRVNAGAVPPVFLGVLAEDTLTALEDVDLSFEDWTPLADELRAFWTPEQQDRFDRGTVVVSLEVPAAVPAGEAVAMRVVCEPRAGRGYDINQRFLYFLSATANLDGVSTPISQRWNARTRSAVAEWTLEAEALGNAPGWVTAPQSPGSYPLELRVVFGGVRGNQLEQTVRATLNVVGPENQAELPVITDPEELREIRRRLAFANISLRSQGGFVSVSMSSGRIVDFDLVADAALEVGTVEVPLGTVHIRGSDHVSYVRFPASTAAVLTGRDGPFTLVLNPNPAAARRALGVERLWHGEPIRIPAEVEQFRSNGHR